MDDIKDVWKNIKGYCESCTVIYPDNIIVSPEVADATCIVRRYSSDGYNYSSYCNNCIKNMFENEYFVTGVKGFGSIELWATIREGYEPPKMNHIEFLLSGWVHDSDPDFDKICDHIYKNQHKLKTTPEYN